MKRPWMPFYPADFFTSTLALDYDEIGVYIKLLCLAWMSGDGSITGDMAELKKVLQNCTSNFHGLTFNRIVPKLLKMFFYEKDGRMYQERVEKELRKAEEISEKQSRNAKERWSPSNKINNLDQAIASGVVIPIQHNTTQHSKKKKEEYAADAAPPKYAFEDGIIRLSHKDFALWEEAYSHLDLRSELMSLSQWAGEQGKNWFHAVKGALSKRNREMTVRQKRAVAQSSLAEDDSW